jgi:formyltetrahydrofolate deformylase
MKSRSSCVMRASCPDRPGVVAAVTGFIRDQGCSILEAQQHGAPGQRFFMRIEFESVGTGTVSPENMQAAFAPIAHNLQIEATFRDTARPMRTVLLVSRFGHCLHYLLHGWQAGQLPLDIAAVASNHEDLRAFTQWCGLPFHHLPISPETKPKQEEHLLRLIEDSEAELVVLARYMQVLSPRLSDALAGRCINIHHSFLPSFKGAKPYHQAYARGVKIIGATAHYVTTDLDEGPIIEQDVRRVSHARSPEELVTIGQEIEASVLARAVRWHAEGRVFVHGSGTVVFD